MAKTSLPIGGHSNFTTTSAERMFGLGDVAAGTDGSHWVYVQANGAIDQYDAVLLDADWQAAAISTTNSANAFGQKVGVVSVAFADDDYGWVQVDGVGTVNALTNCSATTQLNSTGTAGNLDDDQTTGAENINGLVLSATATTSGSYEAILTFPTVGSTLA